MPDITLGYEDMESAAAQLQQGQDRMTEVLQSLESVINNLVDGQFRTQLASARFQESYQQWSNGTQQILEGLSGMATFLNQAVGGYQDLDSSLQQGASGLT